MACLLDSVNHGLVDPLSRGGQDRAFQRYPGNPAYYQRGAGRPGQTGDGARVQGLSGARGTAARVTTGFAGDAAADTEVGGPSPGGRVARNTPEPGSSTCQ